MTIDASNHSSPKLCQLSWLRSSAKWLLDPANFLFTLLSLVPVFLLAVFIFIHKENIAWADELHLLDMVLAIRNGTFNISYLVEEHAGAYRVLTHLITAILVVTTDWNIIVGLSLNVVIVTLSFILTVLLFRRSQREAAVFVMPIFSMFLFSVHQDINWLGIYVGHFFFGPLFFLLGLWLLGRYRDTLWGIGGAAAATLCATFSTGSGILGWPLLGATLYFHGYRKWHYYLFWAAAAVLSLILFLVDYDSGGTTGTIISHASRVLDVVRFVFILLGAVFVSRYFLSGYLDLCNLCLLVGLLGFAVYLMNAAYLWRKEKDKEVCVTWLAVGGYGFASCILIALIRMPLEGGFRNSAFFSWYATLSIQFWIGFAALAAIVVWRVASSSQAGLWRRMLSLINIGVGIMLFTLFIIQNQRIRETSYIGDDCAQHILGTPIKQEWAVEYVFTLDGSRLGDYVWSTNLLAAYRLNVFAHTSPILVLPDEYQGGTPILVETDSAWSSIHIRDWSLAGIEDEDVMFAFPDDPTESIVIPEPLANTVTDFTDYDIDHLDDFLTDAGIFWYIRQEHYPSRLGTLFEGMETRDYVPVSTTVHNPGGYLIIEYRLTP